MLGTVSVFAVREEDDVRLAYQQFLDTGLHVHAWSFYLKALALEDRECLGSARH